MSSSIKSQLAPAYLLDSFFALLEPPYPDTAPPAAAIDLS